MSVKVEKLEHNMAKLNVEVAAEKLEAAIEKAYQKEIQVMSPEAPAHVAEFGEVREEESQEKEKAPVEEPIRPRPGKEVPSPRTAPEVEPPVMPEPYKVPETPTRIQAASDRKNEEKKEKKENPEREVLIRQILEEFMA